MQENREHQTFHAGLKAFIGHEGKLLVLQDEDGLWELPGGRIEQEETDNALKTILMREVTEELGTKIQIEVGSIFHSWIREGLQGKGYFIFLTGFHCDYKGGQISLSKEHKDFKWIAKDDADRLQFENTYKEAIQKYFEVF